MSFFISSLYRIPFFISFNNNMIDFQLLKLSETRWASCLLQSCSQSVYQFHLIFFLFQNYFLSSFIFPGLLIPILAPLRNLFCRQQIRLKHNRLFSGLYRIYWQGKLQQTVPRGLSGLIVWGDKRCSAGASAKYTKKWKRCKHRAILLFSLQLNWNVPLELKELLIEQVHWVLRVKTLTTLFLQKDECVYHLIQMVLGNYKHFIWEVNQTTIRQKCLKAISKIGLRTNHVPFSCIWDAALLWWTYVPGDLYAKLAAVHLVPLQ